MGYFPRMRTLAVVELEDEIRPDAAEIFAYFAAQGVTIKVISGDNPETVAAIAERAGLDVDSEPVDARDLPDGIDDWRRSLEQSTVFGRVAPQQKQAMVKALQSLGHVVAMTGDGVNDVLALKDADLGICMGSGSDATKAVADLVLTDNAFSSLPVVVDEGRKVINNVERVSKLFVTKTAYAVLLTFVVGFWTRPFPFIPRQLTLIGTFSIGVPGFFLALAPEVDLIRPGFLRRVLWFTVPAGIAAGSATLAAYEASLEITGLDVDQARTLATVTLLLDRPRGPRGDEPSTSVVEGGARRVDGAQLPRRVLVPWLRNFFEFEVFWSEAWWYSMVAVAAAGTVIIAIPRITRPCSADGQWLRRTGRLRGPRTWPLAQVVSTDVSSE